LEKAAAKGFLEYAGNKVVALDLAGDNPAIQRAVAKMAAFVDSNNGTGVQELVDHVVYDLLGCITVYPVEDEKKFADHFGNALPDAILLPNGSTPVDLAGKIHSDLAKGFLYAVNARTKMRIGRDEPLKDGDVIKIVSAAK
jgi:ribosome-binding ATPase YchF (GTP1/OBG family)